MPRTIKLDGISSLTREDIPLIEKMTEAGREIIHKSGISSERSVPGIKYFAPSLIEINSQLHIHVISRDMLRPVAKKKATIIPFYGGFH